MVKKNKTPAELNRKIGYAIVLSNMNKSFLSKKATTEFFLCLSYVVYYIFLIVTILRPSVLKNFI